MIRIELVGRPFQKLIKRGVIMLVAGVAVVATVFVAKRMLTSKPAPTASVVSPQERPAAVKEPLPAAPAASGGEAAGVSQATRDTRSTLSSGAAREKATPTREVSRDQTPRRQTKRTRLWSSAAFPMVPSRYRGVMRLARVEATTSNDKRRLTRVRLGQGITRHLSL